MKGAALPRGLRIAFWTVMLFGIAAFAAAVQGQWERLSSIELHLQGRSGLDFILSDLLAPAVLMLGVSWVCFRKRTRDTGVLSWRSVLVDLSAASVCFLLVALLGFGSVRYVMDARANRIGTEADQRWAEIGRPMPEFAKGLSPIKENASLGSLLKMLQPWGVKTLYRNDGGDPGSNNFELPREVMDFYTSKLPMSSDRTESADSACPHLTAKSDELEGIYKAILAQEPPAWEFDPKSGLSQRMPSGLVLRKLCQMIGVDSIRRSSNGDMQGAADAVNAALRVSEGFRNSRSLVAEMISCAVECLLATCVAQLPEEPHALERMRDRADSERKNLKSALQYEAFSVLHWADPSCFPDIPSGNPFPVVVGLPRWLNRSLEMPYYHLQAAIASLETANMVAVIDKVDFGTSKDLCLQELDRASGILTPGCLRAWLRVNVALLREEQAEVIRYARGRMQDGTITEHTKCPSAVIPGVTWEIIPNVSENSIALKLSRIPDWAVNSPVIGPEFYFLPLDGSKSWKFASRTSKPTGA